MENIFKDWKKEQTLSVTFPNADLVKAVNEQLSLMWTFGKATVQVL